ncbi:MAG TPA: hypothetical protein VGU02_09090 [Gaiellaceae bacterium]|nr:hypothetical protein [Gaiellaceae bacterium]
MPRAVEEARCVLSPGAHGFPLGAVFCHSPDHRIWEFTANGHRRLVTVLPTSDPTADDGAIAFDEVGRFGFALLAATGRSGAGQPPGGAVFAIDSRGHARLLGHYTGSGGADQLIVAPARFGSAPGEALLTVDDGATGGRLVAVAPDGSERTLMTFPDGPNPIVRLNSLASGRLYLTDDERRYVYVAAAAPLRRYAGDVLIGSETRALFWVVRPNGAGFVAVPVGTNFHASKHSLEAITLAP